MKELLAQLQADGFSIPNLTLNGKVNRFQRTGKNSGWFVGYDNTAKKGESYIVAVYGDWKTGEKYEYKTKREYTKAQASEILKRIRSAQGDVERERSQIQESAQCKAQGLWDTGGDNSRCDYLSRKSIDSLHGCRTTLGADGRILLVPMRDCDGLLWGVQKISGSGTKFFTTGQRVEGCFHSIGEPLTAVDQIYICEGFATAASIFQSFGIDGQKGKAVVCAFNASNLVPVAEQLKEKYPTCAFIICGDDDVFTERDGQPYNPGREYAEKARGACAGSIVFPKFSSLETKPTDFNDLHSLEGLGAVKAQILGAEDKGKQYVLCLGFVGDKYYYTSSSNMYVIGLTASAHNKLQLLSLMSLSYWQGIYPSEKGESGVDWNWAIDDLMNRCRMNSSFTLSSVRGPGAWRGDSGELVLNTGEDLWVNGLSKGFHSIKSRFVYAPGDHFLPKPKIGKSDIATVEECQEFVKTISGFRWAHKDYFKYLSGWLMIAPISGALSWRPHIWISGPSGSGKSTIMTEVVHRVLRKTAMLFQGASTEAGIRQCLGSKALPVVFDEFETNDVRSGFRVSALVELFRQASSETDANIVKGSATGQATSYSVRFAGLVSSVQVNLTFEADRNRFTVIELERAGEDTIGAVNHFSALCDRLYNIDAEFCARLYNRSFAMWDVFCENRFVLMQEISKTHPARFAQQYGTLLAGYALLMTDDKLSEIDAEFIVKTSDLGIKSSETDGADERECLDHLLSKQVYVNGSVNQQLLVSELIQNATNFEIGYGGPTSEWNKILERFGMSIKYGKDKSEAYLCVAANNAELNKLFEGTKWVGIYSRSLSRIKGSDRYGDKPVKIGGVAKKVIRIPLSLIQSI